MPRSREFVKRNGELVYSPGDEIPASDVDELTRQGLIGPDDAPAKKAAGKKTGA